MQELKITGLDVYVCETRENIISDSTRTLDFLGFTFVVIKTNTEISGVGVTYNDLCGHAFAVFIKDVLEPLLIGKNPLDHEDIYDYLCRYCHCVGRRGFTFYPLSAIDTALWDLKGKVAGLPLYKMFGGGKTQVPVYGSGGWVSYSKKDLLAEITRMLESGYKAVKMKVGVKGGTDIDEDVARVAAVRKEIGDGRDLMIDANNVWKSGEAIQFARKVEQYNIKWFEEPVTADDMEGLAHVRAGTSIPIATGEHEYTRFGVRDLVLNKAMDILQSDAGKCGGYTELLKMNAIAQAWNLKFAPHCMDFLHMHMVSAAPNGLILERLIGFDNIMKEMFLNPPVITNGMMQIPDLPGLGLLLNMDYFASKKVK